MSEMEEKMNAVLSNPQLMQQIAAMAQALGGDVNAPPSEPKEPAPGPNAAFDPRLIQAMTQTMGQTGIDSNQKFLLQALSPYLSSHRVQKLERAMQAARLAGAASACLSAGGLQMLTGR